MPSTEPPSQKGAAWETASRAMVICNVCRYCDGYCEVFLASLRRWAQTQTAPSPATLTYLAHLCHHCGNCLYACQYAPPHTFNINIPSMLAGIRHESYQHYAWPRVLGCGFACHGRVVAAVMGAATLLVCALSLALIPGPILFGTHTGPGAFYRLIPWEVMGPVAGLTLGWSLLAIGVGVARFWRDSAGPLSSPPSSLPRALLPALRDVLTLRLLGGGGAGCNDRDERFSRARRRWHHLMFYGFLLCTVSTALATLYHHGFGWPAPYPLPSLPVLLGTLGGVAMLAGSAGLAWVRRGADPLLRSPTPGANDAALMATLAAVAGSGLLLLGLRETPALGLALAVHLGTVLGFFLLLPYCRLVHGAYRTAALLRAALDRQDGARPGRVLANGASTHRR